MKSDASEAFRLRRICAITQSLDFWRCLLCGVARRLASLELWKTEARGPQVCQVTVLLQIAHASFDFLSGAQILLTAAPGTLQPFDGCLEVRMYSCDVWFSVRASRSARSERPCVMIYVGDLCLANMTSCESKRVDQGASMFCQLELHVP